MISHQPRIDQLSGNAPRRMKQDDEPSKHGVQRAVEQAGNLIKSHPVAALTAAVALGAALGWWVKRK